MVPLYLFTQIPECPDDQPSLAFSLPSSRVAQACGGGPLTLTLGPGERNNQALLAAPVQGGRMGGGSGGPGAGVQRPAQSHTHCPLPRSNPPGPSTAQPARRGNPLQSEEYVHRAGCAPSPGGTLALRSAACCRRSAEVTPIRCRPTGKATGFRWTAGCPSSAGRLGAWGSAWRQGTWRDLAWDAGLRKRPLSGGKGSPPTRPLSEPGTLTLPQFPFEVWGAVGRALQLFFVQFQVGPSTALVNYPTH